VAEPIRTYHQNDLAAVRGAEGIEWLSPQEAANRIAAGEAAPVTKDDVFRSYYRDDPVLAAGMGLARGASLGASDIGLAAAFGEDTVKEYKEESPAASFGGELVGMLGSAVIPGGPLAQVGRGAKAAVDVTRLATKAPGAARVATAALEGAGVAGAFGATQAAWDPDKTAADVLKDVAAGAALGGGFSLAGLGIGRLGRFVGEKIGSRARKALEKQESLQAELSTLRKQHGLVDAELKAELGVAQKPIIDEIAGLEEQIARVKAGPAVPAATKQLDQLRQQLEVAKGSLGKAKEAMAYERVELREQLQRRIDGVKAQLAPTTAGILGKVSRYIMNRKLAHAVAGGMGGGTVATAIGWSTAPAVVAKLGNGLRPTIGEGTKGVAQRVGGTLGKAGRAVRLPFYKLGVDGVMQLREDLDATDLGQLRAELMAGMPSDVSEGAAQEAVDETIKGLAFLKKAAWSPGPTALGETPRPNARQVEATSAVARAAVDPDSVLEDLTNLTLTDEGLSTLEALYPNQLDLMRQRMRPLLGARKDYSLREVQQLSLFFRDPTLVTLFADPALGVFMQDVLEQQKKQKGRPRRRTVKAHEREATRLERAQEK
jgi:hypothetical protein